MLSSEILWKFLDCFTNHFEISDYRIEGFLVFEERGFGQVCRIGYDLMSGLQNVFQVDPRIPGHRWLLVE
jgi:hypothetical protein